MHACAANYVRLQQGVLQLNCNSHANCNIASCSLIAICMQIATWHVAVKLPTST